MARNETKSYFSHDSNARNDEKMIRLRMKHGAAGYGVFFMIVERLRDESDYMSERDYDMIAFDLHEEAELVRSVIEDFGLFTFTDDGLYFYSESLMSRMQPLEEEMKRRSENGKRAVQKRWAAKKSENQKAEGNENVAPEDDSECKNTGIENQQVNTTAIPVVYETDSSGIPLEYHADTKLNEIKLNKIAAAAATCAQAREAAADAAADELKAKVEEYKAKPIWKESVQKMFNLSPPEIDEQLDAFYLDMRCREYHVQNVSSMFTRWLKENIPKKDNPHETQQDKYSRRRGLEPAAASRQGFDGAF